MAWKLRRLRVMGVAEIAHRASRVLQAGIERVGIGLARDAGTIPGAVPATQPWLALSPAKVDVARHAAAADRILDGHFAIFAEAGLALGFPPRWNPCAWP